LKNNFYELSKLNPLAELNHNYLTEEQKIIIHTNANKKAAPRKPKTIDYLTLPELAFSELPGLYNNKYKEEKGNHEYRLNLYRLFLHLIYATHETNLVPQYEYFPLSDRILEILIGKNELNHTTVRNDLVAWGYIEVNGSYRVGNIEKGIEGYCKSFRLAKRLLADTFKSYRVKGIKYSDKAEKDLGNKAATLILNKSTPQYAWLKQNLNKCFFSPEVYQWIDGQEYINAKLKDKRRKVNGVWKLMTDRYFTADIAQHYRTLVEEFNNRYQDGNPAFSVGKINSRLDTGLTNAPSGIRRFFRVDGLEEELMYLDLSSSQVYLLLPLLEKASILKNNVSEDYKLFKSLVLGKTFYTDLVAELENHFHNLKIPGDAKVNLFKYVIYSIDHKEEGMRKYFNQRFPNVNKAIMELVSSFKGEEGLAVQLQKVEADYFLDKICPRILAQLGEKTFCATLHDGIICAKSDFDEIYNIMIETLLAQTGNIPSLKYDNLTNPIEEQELVLA
jgi:hypothetical protein